MNVRFGMPEMMVLFATALLWHSAVVAGCIFGLAVFSAMCRFALEFTEKQKIQESKNEALNNFSGQVDELGETLGQLFGNMKNKKKTNTNLH
jgi:hypothetical protein